jgi:pimeloyl-ACP methyl ester carboxylesterase
MVHGYCASSNPWKQVSSAFTDAVYVEFLQQSDTNDQFAKKIFDFAEAQGLSSYSAIGYSQGGSAITHLKAHYWSGLDLITSGRKIQSVVTPYMGTSAAGSAAGLGSALGVGCGKNYDLSRDGAPLWAAGIPTATRQELYFYYVQYGDNGFNTRFCNNAMNMVLEKPNDGTTEVAYAPLPSANNLGLTISQCHTGTMKYPAAFTDSGRNSALNSNTGRS